MRKRGERLFAWLVRLYPREFRERYRDDLLAFFRQDREHRKYGSGILRPARFWAATVRDLARAAWSQHRAEPMPSASTASADRETPGDVHRPRQGVDPLVALRLD